MVARYIQILDKIVTENLDLAKSNQLGRVTEDATAVTIDFTERWFRELINHSLFYIKVVREGWKWYTIKIEAKMILKLLTNFI